MNAITGRRFRKRRRAAPRHRSGLLLVAVLVAVGLSLASPGAAAAAHGPTHGPDSFGYTAFSIPFSFEDISATGT
jgi:hypothetical protein